MHDTNLDIKCKTVIGAMLDGIPVEISGNTYGLNDDLVPIIKLMIINTDTGEKREDWVVTDIMLSEFLNWCADITEDEFTKLCLDITASKVKL